MCTFPVIIIVFVDSFWLFACVFFRFFVCLFCGRSFKFFFIFIYPIYIAFRFLLCRCFSFFFFFFLSLVSISAIFQYSSFSFCLLRIPSHFCFSYHERIVFCWNKHTLALCLLFFSLRFSPSMIFFIGRVFVRSCIWISFCGFVCVNY